MWHFEVYKRRMSGDQSNLSPILSAKAPAGAIDEALIEAAAALKQRAQSSAVVCSPLLAGLFGWLCMQA